MSFRGNLLTVSDVRKAYGGVQAVNGASFSVREGTITGLIGPNGAGKSTMVNLISGAERAQSGSIHFANQDITRLPTHRIAHLGLVRTFQISRELQRLTVLENLLLAPQHQFGEKSWAALFARRRIQEEEQRHLRKALEMLDRFSLLPLKDEYAGNLSGGQKKLLDLARALMAEPKMLLLDEPMAGVNPTLTRSLQEHIAALNKEGMTFLLIEHNLSVVESICDHVVVMAEGRVLAEGKMDTLRDNEAVVSAYLGG
ncbi:MAG: ABC transporter ATP-binding protein [Alicyclobacillus sp.]|nr:ABC transporter ATP-binding protein [Alicyclobacillus sp.]